MPTLLIAEHDNKTLRDATAKAVTAAQALGGDVHVPNRSPNSKVSARCSWPKASPMSMVSRNRSPR